jgi:hypothetical protein
MVALTVRPTPILWGTIAGGSVAALIGNYHFLRFAGHATICTDSTALTDIDIFGPRTTNLAISLNRQLRTHCVTPTGSPSPKGFVHDFPSPKLSGLKLALSSQGETRGRGCTASMRARIQPRPARPWYSSTFSRFPTRRHSQDRALPPC